VLDSPQISGAFDIGAVAGESSGLILNVHIAGTGYIEGSGDRIGGLVGESNGSIIDSSVGAGIAVAGNYRVGGVVGDLFASTSDIISNVHSQAVVSGGSYVGGFAGSVSGPIANSSAAGDVSGDYWVGGFVGSVNEGELEKIRSSGNVTGNVAVGGIAGQIEEGTVSNCYSVGDVSGASWKGGIAGLAYYDTKLENCYSRGVVTDIEEPYSIAGVVGQVGGLLIEDWGTVVFNSYFNIEANPDSIEHEGAEGKTAAELKLISTYLPEWDITTSSDEIESIWKITDDPDGIDYPYLSWE